MAEETTSTIPDDIREKIADMQSMFSGGLINPLLQDQARIQVPEVPRIPMPQSSGSTIPKLSGEYTGELDSPVKYAEALKNHLNNAGTWAADPYKYGKTYAYDADYTGLNFARYYNTPRIYKKIGFSPWRDNEKIYNEKMTWFDSFRRSAGQAGKLMGTGFSSMLPWNAWDGDDTDEKSAKEMERAHAIGNDNRGGIGGFFNNLMLDSGYTLGIGAEFAMEELALWGAAALTEGALAEVAVARTGSNVARITDKLFNKTKILTDLNEALKGLSSVSKSRDVFKAVKSGKPVQAILDILTPQTAKFAFETANLARTAKAAKAGENIYNLARASKGVGAFYRDAREIAAVLSESKLEGGSVELEMRQKLTDEFYKNNNRMPNVDEYYDIFQAANNAGKETYLYNLPALWLSNKIVFDKALKGLPGMNTIRKELSEGLAGKLIFDKAKYLAGKDAWDIVKTGIRQDVKSLFTKQAWAPKNLLRNGLTKIAVYGKENITEALQEQYQDAIANTTKEYYESRFSHPSRTSMHESWGEIFARNAGKQFTTAQGWETFTSGFLMGSLVQFPQHIVYEKMPEKIFQLFKPGQREQREQRTNNVVNALNAITKDPQKFFNPNITNAISQGILNEQGNKALQNGDIKSYGDIRDESVFEHIHTLIQTDKLDLIRDYLKDMKELSGEELEQAYGKIEPDQGDSKVFYAEKIDNMLGRIDQIESRSKFIEDRYGNPFDIKTQNDEWQAWEMAKKYATYSSYSFDRTVERMNGILQDVSRDPIVAKANSSDFTVLFDGLQLDREISTLKNEISSLEEITGQAKEVSNKTKRLEALETFKSDLNIYRQTLQSIAKGDIQVEEDPRLEDSLKNLHKSFKGYVKVVAKVNDSVAFDKNIDSAFVKLKDFYHLKNDSTNLADVVNFLENHADFVSVAQRNTQAVKDIRAGALEMYRKSAESSENTKEFNQLLNAVIEEGVYFMPDDIAPLFKDLKVPTVFYDVVSKELLSPENPKYKAVQELINKYIELRSPEPVTTEKPIEEEKGEEKKPESDKLKIISKTPIEDMPDDLVKRLMEAYREFNRKRYQESDEKNPADSLLTPRALSMTDAELKNHITFKSFLDYPKAKPIFVKYNEETGRTIEPEVKEGVAKTPTTTLVVPTVAMKSELKALGYSDSDISRMKHKEAERIITNKIVPGSEEAAKLAEQVKTEEASKKRRQEVVDIVKSNLDKVDSIKALIEFENVMGELIISGELISAGLTSDILEELISKKKSELRIGFDDINEGDVIMVQGEKDPWIVDKKTSDSIKIRKYGDETLKKTITKENLANQIVYKEGMEDISMTPTEQDLQDYKNSRKVAEDIDSEKNNKKADSRDENDLLDDIGSDDNCKK
jgi:hypothetical protein